MNIGRDPAQQNNKRVKKYMAYATIADVQARTERPLTIEEQSICAAMLDDAAVIIDSYNVNASADVKKLVSCRMVERIIGAGSDAGIPAGATQGSVSALGYSQSWTIGNGTAGELYLSKQDKRLLGTSNAIGSHSPTEENA